MTREDFTESELYELASSNGKELNSTLSNGTLNSGVRKQYFHTLGTPARTQRGANKSTLIKKSVVQQ